MTTHPIELLGAHALGALEPDEARAVQAHLATCAACREQHAELAAIPGLLALTSLDGEAPAAADAPAGLEQRIIAAARDARRARRSGLRLPARRSWSVGLGGALAGAAATVAVLASSGALNGSTADSARTVRLTGAGTAATAILHAQPGGTRVDLRIDALPATRGAQLYELWFVRPHGRVSAGTFTTAGAAGGTLRVALNTAASPDGYDRIGVTREPDGVDPARNGPNVLTASLQH